MHWVIVDVLKEEDLCHSYDIFLIFISTVLGGRDTAGLGGKGGPYRLDAGHKVYQISQAEKDAVPEEVKRAAREMGEKAFKQRLVFKFYFRLYPPSITKKNSCMEAL